jgi:hypothetical protein
MIGIKNAVSADGTDEAVERALIVETVVVSEDIELFEK